MSNLRSELSLESTLKGMDGGAIHEAGLLSGAVGPKSCRGAVGPNSSQFLCPTRWPVFDPKVLQLWTQVAVRGELGPDREFVKWDEPTWEKKRQELAAAKPPDPDFPFPGYVATDKLHWLRAEYEAADEKDKLRWATELLQRAEKNGDTNEAVRWRAEVARRTHELAPPPREAK